VVGSHESRLKQHLASGFKNVQKCKRCPKEVKDVMKKHLNEQKKRRGLGVRGRQSLGRLYYRSLGLWT